MTDLAQEPPAATVPPSGGSGGSGRAASALSWSVLNAASSKVASLVIGVALARMLGPAEFGVFAVAMVALLAVLSFNELGVSLAIVRWEGDPARIAPTATTISIGASLVVTAVTLVVAGPFAVAMGAPEAAWPVRLLALCILANGVVATPAMLLQRHFRQDRRLIADQVNIWLGALVSLLLVALGAGAMGLVVGRLVGTVLSGVLLVRFSPLPYRLGFDRTLARGLVRFGLPLAGASVLVFGLGFADQLVVGQQLGPVALGAYVLAYNLAGWPLQLLSQPLRSVAPAVFARLQDQPAQMRDGLVAISRPLLVLALPGCLALSVGAEPAIRLLYGEQWAASVGPLRWLALLAAARIVAELAYDYLVIAAPTWWLLVLQGGWLVALVPALLVGARIDGADGAALAGLLVGGVVVLPAYAVLLARVGVATARLVPGLLVALVGCVVIALGALALDLAPAWPPLVELAALGVLTLGVCGALLYLQRDELALLRRGEVPA